MKRTNLEITPYESYAVCYSDQVLGFTNAGDCRIDGLLNNPSEKALTEVTLVGPVESVDSLEGLLAAPQITFSIAPTKMRLDDYLSRSHDANARSWWRVQGPSRITAVKHLGKSRSSQQNHESGHRPATRRVRNDMPG